MSECVRVDCVNTMQCCTPLSSYVCINKTTHPPHLGDEVGRIPAEVKGEERSPLRMAGWVGGCASMLGVERSSPHPHMDAIEQHTTPLA